MKNKAIYFDGRKAVDLWGDNLAGWTVYSGEGSRPGDEDYYKLIPTLFRAVQSNANSVSAMPFDLMKGKTMYDSSADWKNKVGFLPNPFVLLQLVNSALDLAGACYLFRERSAAATKALRYHLPSSVKPIINDITGKIEYFEKTREWGTEAFKPEDYVYFWLPDPYVEIGPAINYPASAAANACGVLLNIDVFAESFFERGAIKAMLLTVKGMPAEAERQKLSDWWQRVVAGIKNAFGAQVINAEAITPVVVGEGMKELENVTIGQEKREDVAMALNIPMSKLFANAANRATAEQDALDYLNQNTIPRCQFIQSVLNEQVFESLGLHWEFRPETLDAMQEDEASRSMALQQLTSAGIPLLMAMDILGYEITDEQRAELEAAEEEKKAKAEEMANRLAEKPNATPAQEREVQTEQTAEENTTFKSELDKWKRKAINAMKKGKPANVDFVTTAIPETIYENIMTALGNAQTENDVKGAFDVTQSPEPKFGDSIMVLANELKRANDILERTAEK